MIKAIIFDCFGVLAEDGWTPFKRQYIGSNAKLVEEVADLGKQTDMGIINYEEMIKQTSQLIDVDPEILRAAVSRKVPNEELFAYIDKKLKPKYKIGLLSNANYDVTTQLFSSEQASLFDASVLSYEAGLTKPDVRMYQLISQRLGVETGECLYIDDLEHYCIAAENLGMKSIFYQNLEECLVELDKIA